MTITSLWRSVNVNVAADSKLKLFINFCYQSSLKSATDCCQTERQIQQDAWGSVRIACVSQQFLHENCLQVLEKGQWSPNNSKFEWNGDIVSGERRMKLFWNLHPKPRTVSESKIAPWRRYGAFSAGPINEAVLSFASSLTRVRGRWRKTF